MAAGSSIFRFVRQGESMVKNHLPADLQGDWIWLGKHVQDVESYIFFRREFTLDGIPSSADLWIAARTFFHVFVNGTHVGYGLAANPGPQCYAWYYDIAYLLATGVNTIAILAHNTTVSRSCCRRQASGLWCQVNIDGAPAVWTGRSWKAKHADCFAPNRPRRSSASGFAEKQDLRLYPEGWAERGFNADGWQVPDHHIPVTEKPPRLRSFPAPEMTVQAVPFELLAVRGSCRQESVTTNVTFEKLVAEHGTGVYAAESYVHVSDLTEIIYELYCDSPYRLFVNGKCIKEQGVRPLSSGASYQACRSLGFGQGDLVDPSGRVLLEKGWNHLVFFQELEPGEAGMTLLISDHHIKALRVVREPDADSLPGWTIAGPLRTPLANILGNFTLNLVPAIEYHIPLEGRPVDESAELMSWQFEAAADSARKLAEAETLELQAGEYVILELPHSVYGCPALVLDGTAGDIVQIVTGTEILDGQLLPWDDGRRNVDSIILAAGDCEWMACAPRGVRYLQIIAAKLHRAVRIRQVQVRVRQYAFGNPGRFECSDDLLNRIWQTGERTLRSTVQEVFLDSPAKDETQYIADAMLEAWAAHHVFGDFGLSAKGLEEFAMAQFETGEMPAACPSDIYCNIPDYALLWPVWLQRHYQYTGDRQLLERFLPNLEKLYSYFSHIAVAGRDVLGGLGERHGGYCFLDHADIDRRGVVTGLNALYCRSLLCGAALFEAAEQPEQARPLREVCSRVAQQMRELTWDAERHLFADGWHNGTRSERFSLQSNILAIYGGLARSDEYERIFDEFFCDKPPYQRPSEGNEPNPYFKYFILETAFALGRRQWALDFMRWYWGGMLKRGARTWWELFDPAVPEAQLFVGSRCHGYGTSPNGFLISEVAGVRPANPGFTTIFFSPLTAGLKWVKAKIPTMYGQIVVEWEMKKGGQLHSVIDANYPLSVIPELDPGIAASATIHVSDEVTIFASEEDVQA
jgi:hypothetical protein